MSTRIYMTIDDETGEHVVWSGGRVSHRGNYMSALAAAQEETLRVGETAFVYEVREYHSRHVFNTASGYFDITEKRDAPKTFMEELSVL